MERLVEVRPGSRDVVVGVSGFGSARVHQSRWGVVGRLTGRTTFALGYDSQDLPFNVLIDGEGTILAKNLHGVELEQGIAKYMVSHSPH